MKDSVTEVPDARLFLEIVKNSRRVSVLTGAGVSVASGIPDFRSSNGLYSMVSQEIFELDFFLRDPAAYYKIARERIHVMIDREPNPTHYLLAKLQEKGYIGEIITQNIDSLHQKAGASKVIELHGNASHFSCMNCGRRYSRSAVEELLDSNDTPLCSCLGLIKPDIVFFGEMLPIEAIQRAETAAAAADLFISMGSSLVVYPAANLPIISRSAGASFIIVNRDPTDLDYLADRVFNVTLEDFSSEVLSILDKES